MKSRISLYDIIIICVLLAIGYGAAKIHTIISNTTTEDTIVDIFIDGRTEYGLGDIAEFSSSTNNKNVLLISDWKIINNNKDVDFKTIKNGNIIFPVGINKSNIQLIFHGSYIDPKTKKLKTSGFVVKNITVGSPAPTPPPDPGPLPEPIIIPDGKYKIANLAYTTAVALVQSDKINLSAQELSKSLNEIADNINKDQYKTLKDVYSALGVNNNQHLSKAGENPNNWQPWDDVIKKEIARLHNNKQLPKLTDHADLLKEIAIGLSYIK